MELSLHSNDQKKKKKPAETKFLHAIWPKEGKDGEIGWKDNDHDFFFFLEGGYTQNHLQKGLQWMEWIHWTGYAEKKPTFTKEYQNNTQVQFHWSN